MNKFMFFDTRQTRPNEWKTFKLPRSFRLASQTKNKPLIYNGLLDLIGGAEEIV